MILTETSCGTIRGSDQDRYAEDVAALVHFSDYIAKEARRLGLSHAAEKARLVQRELLSALEHN